MKVKNLHTESGKKQGSSWLNHWEISSRIKAGNCSINGCTSPATDGAHVKKVNSSDNAHYIVPMCHKCNMSPEELELKANTHLAPVNLK